MQNKWGHLIRRMPGKELPTTVENAAAAFAEGDAETKISMLKKAVISVTKHKAEVEQRCAALEEKLAQTAAELGSVHQQNTQLHTTILANNAEIDALKRKLSTTTAASVASAALKGITNLIPMGAGSAEGSAAAAAGGKSQPSASRASSVPSASGGSFIALSAEDQQRLFEENEALHIQIFELRSSLEGQVRSLEKVNATQAAQIANLKRSVSQLEGAGKASREELENTKQASKEDRMVAHYLTMFSELSSRKDASSSPAADHQALLGNAQSGRGDVSPLITLRGGQLDRHLAQFLTTKIEEYLEMFSSLVAGVGTLLSALDDSIGRVPRSTNADENTAVRDRFRTVLESHRQHRSGIVEHISAIRVCLSSTDYQSSTWSAFETHTQAMSRTCLLWLALVRHSLPIIVECAVALLPRDHVFVFARNLPQQAAGSRDIYVSMLVTSLGAVVGAAMAALRVTSSLLEKVSKSQPVDSRGAGSLLDWSAMLWWVLWRSSEGCAELATACANAYTLMIELSEHCGDDRAQVAVKYIAQIVQAVGSTSGLKEELTTVNQDQCIRDADASSTMQRTASSTVVDDRAASAAVDELKEALQQADASAVRHYVQLQRVLLELHEQQGQLDALRKELAIEKKDAAGREAELQHVVDAYEEQIRLLSDRLADLA